MKSLDIDLTNVQCQHEDFIHKTPITPLFYLDQWINHVVYILSMRSLDIDLTQCQHEDFIHKTPITPLF